MNPQINVSMSVECDLPYRVRLRVLTVARGRASTGPIGASPDAEEIHRVPAPRQELEEALGSRGDDCMDDGRLLSREGTISASVRHSAY